MEMFPGSRVRGLISTIRSDRAMFRADPPLDIPMQVLSPEVVLYPEFIQWKRLRAFSKHGEHGQVAEVRIFLELAQPLHGYGIIVIDLHDDQVRGRGVVDVVHGRLDASEDQDPIGILEVLFHGAREDDIR